MAEAFQPKFVDLVRNATSVVGTGPVTLGSAVPGYTGIAQALGPGDQFYYCIQGVDRPQEREVGRGTLQADDKIARQPINGGLTNFSSGTKTIALVAAAEWFSRLELSGGSAAIDVASRAALASKPPASSAAAVLTEPGREGLFVFDPADLSAKVASDTRQAICVPTQADPAGGAGAWVRKSDGPINVRWFGAKGDGSTDDSGAFTAALAFLKSVARADGVFFKGSPRLFIPSGHYFLGTTTLDITHSLVIEGEGSGHMVAGNATKLRWAANTTGLRFQDSNTTGASGTQPDEWSSSGSTLRGLHLMGGYEIGGTPEGEYHGIHLKVPVTIEDVAISNFQGDGVYASTTAPVGNSNNCRLSRMRIIHTRNGIFVDGADVNAWLVQGVDATYSRQFGFYDSSFLGNTYLTCHTANCGAVLGNHVPSATAHGGHWYTPALGQESWCSTNAPSGTATNNQGWIWMGAYGAADSNFNVPAWASGITVRAGGSYLTDNANASTVLLGCYSESGYPGAQFASSTMVIGGAMGAGVHRGQGWLFASDGIPASTAGFRAIGAVNGTIRTQLGSGEDWANGLLTHFNTGAFMGGSPGVAWPWVNDCLHFTMWRGYHGADTTPFQISGYGASAANAPWGVARLNFPQGYGLGGKKVLSAASAPTAGSFNPGDTVWNSAPVAGGPAGWMCVSGGAPGTWKAMASVSS